MRTNEACAIITDIKKVDALYPLTDRRPVSLLPFDGIYRMIDFNLSSITDANIRSVFMLFNQNSIRSVLDHVSSGKEWNLHSLKNRYFMHFYKSLKDRQPEDDNYLDAMIEYIERSKSKHTVFIGNRMLCNLDLTQVEEIHKKHEEDITVVYKKVPRDTVSKDDVILRFNEDNQITQAASGETAVNDTENLFMNIFMVKSDWLVKELKCWRGQEGFVFDIEDMLKEVIMTKTAWGFEYTGYLSHIRDVKSYYDANMEMLKSRQFLSLLHSSKKVYMKNTNEVPTYYAASSRVKISQVATGCLIYGELDQAIISTGKTIEEKANVQESIVMSNVTIKQEAEVKYAIIDKNVIIEPGVRVIGTLENPVVITKNSHVTEDVILVEV